MQLVHVFRSISILRKWHRKVFENLDYQNQKKRRAVCVYAKEYQKDSLSRNCISLWQVSHCWYLRFDNNLYFAEASIRSFQQKEESGNPL